MTPDAIFADFADQWKTRQFAAGLIVAMIDLFKALGVPALQAHSFKDVQATYPVLNVYPNGKPANTLALQRLDGSHVTLRPYFNGVETLFRDTHHRYDFPKCAPHGTQAWRGYMRWLDALSTYSDADLDSIRERVVKFVLQELPDQSFDPDSVELEPPLFERVLRDFDLLHHKGEKSGAAYQGIVFGFLRADNPHLQVEIDKVRTGSSRRKRIGDIDAWEGRRLAITAEVKQYELSGNPTAEFSKFIWEARQRGAIGMVVALSFAEGTADLIEAKGIHAIDRNDMSAIVSLWDPMKQRTAVASLVYYVEHVEQSSALAARLRQFLDDTSAAFFQARKRNLDLD